MSATRDPSRREVCPEGATPSGRRGAILFAGLLALSCSSGGSDETGPSGPGPFETGSITFTVRTVGDEIDPNGYSIVLDGAVVSVPVTGEVTIGNLAFGPHTVEVQEIAPNCRLTNHPISQDVNILSDGDERIDLVVLCLRPNPGRILYVRRGGAVETISALGGDRDILPIRAGAVDVSPVDGRLVFDTRGVVPPSDIWVANPDGTNPVNLTNSPGPAEERPVWSPDGTQIAYKRQEIQGNSEWDIYVINADGSGVTNLTPNTPDWTDGEPAWSPDGTRIVFRSHRSGSGDLYTIRPDGTDLTQLTTDGNFDVNARWSPDGSEIVFARFGNPVTDWDLYRINADGSGLTPLTSDPRRSTEADWSPDGQWIVFASARRVPDLLFDLFLMRRDGSDRVQLTFDERVGLPRWVP